MDLAVMVEGQEGVGWEDWLRLARAAEDHGFQALLRSDHYFSVAGDAQRGALDAWGTVCALAAVTERIRLGTLVSPVTFRPPAVLAKLALTADHVSGGRIDVGMGTGWWEAEHQAFGFAFPPMKERMDELERQLEAVTRLWRDTGPPPVQEPHPRIVLGGQAGPRAARLAGTYADEYNTLFCSPDEARARGRRVREAAERAGRDPASMRLSLMAGFVVGADEDELHHRAKRLMAWRGESASDPAAWVRSRVRDEFWLGGTPDEVVGQLQAYADAGIERVMLQHHLFDDVDVLALIGEDVLPRVGG